MKMLPLSSIRPGRPFRAIIETSSSQTNSRQLHPSNNSSMPVARRAINVTTTTVGRPLNSTTPLSPARPISTTSDDPKSDELKAKLRVWHSRVKENKKAGETPSKVSSPTSGTDVTAICVTSVPSTIPKRPIPTLERITGSTVAPNAASSSSGFSGPLSLTEILKRKKQGETPGFVRSSTNPPIVSPDIQEEDCVVEDIIADQKALLSQEAVQQSLHEPSTATQLPVQVEQSHESNIQSVTKSVVKQQSFPETDTVTTTPELVVEVPSLSVKHKVSIVTPGPAEVALTPRSPTPKHSPLPSKITLKPRPQTPLQPQVLSTPSIPHQSPSPLPLQPSVTPSCPPVQEPSSESAVATKAPVLLEKPILAPPTASSGNLSSPIFGLRKTVENLVPSPIESRAEPAGKRPRSEKDDIGRENKIARMDASCSGLSSSSSVSSSTTLCSENLAKYSGYSDFFEVIKKISSDTATKEWLRSLIEQLNTPSSPQTFEQFVQPGPSVEALQLRCSAASELLSSVRNRLLDKLESGDSAAVNEKELLRSEQFNNTRERLDAGKRMLQGAIPDESSKLLTDVTTELNEFFCRAHVNKDQLKHYRFR